jgi:hypothetical protein
MIPRTTLIAASIGVELALLFAIRSSNGSITITQEG